MRGGRLARYSAATDNFVNADDGSTTQAAKRREHLGGGSSRFSVGRAACATGHLGFPAQAYGKPRSRMLQINNVGDQVSSVP